jgi:hypothetical protein
MLPQAPKSAQRSLFGFPIPCFFTGSLKAVDMPTELFNIWISFTSFSLHLVSFDFHRTYPVPHVNDTTCD